MGNLPSILLENAVSEFATLPGIGQKTALRLVLHLLKQDPEQVDQFGNAIMRLRHEVQYCRCCHNISDSAICQICSSSKRDHQTVCVVENVRDVMALENTQQYQGVYHVLGGVISPVDGIGPADLEIDSLLRRIQPEGIKEVIMALPTTTEGDTTAFFLYRKLADCDVQVTALARGVAVGGDLEYTDQVTLGRSLLNRVAYKG